MDERDLLRRAMAAYYKSGSTLIPSDIASGVWTVNDKVYVVLASGAEIYAIYRLRNDGVLRRLRRYPKDITKHYDT